ncbi:hypothetical protein PMAYCL1PPCAC_08485, partial [Pristionchus mayeri]
DCPLHNKYFVEPSSQMEGSADTGYTSDSPNSNQELATLDEVPESSSKKLSIEEQQQLEFRVKKLRSVIRRTMDIKVHTGEIHCKYVGHILS